MTIWLWVGFITLIAGLLALDLGVLNRRQHAIGIREAILWTCFWIALALGFAGIVYLIYANHWFGVGFHGDQPRSGHDAVLEYVTGYLIEESLSLDNIFVMALIFSYFNVPNMYRHRVLFWGILGAQVLRGVMILAGVSLIQRFEWMIFVFGGLLVVTAIKMFFSNEEKMDPEKSYALRMARRVFPVSDHFDGPQFFTRINGRAAVTPLFLVLILIESTDVVFAIDSIPAIFGVTQDPFIIFTSNIFAILGLRSLYFALDGMMGRFHHLKTAIVLVLGFVGVKMLLSHYYPISTHVSLIVIGATLAAGIAASMFMTRPGRSPDALPSGEPQQEPRDRGEVKQR